MHWEKKKTTRTTRRQKSDDLFLGAAAANEVSQLVFGALVPDGGREASCLLVVKVTGLPPTVFGGKAEARAPFKQQLALLES